MMMTFPNARHSLRKWRNHNSENQHKESQQVVPVPVPVAVELHNFLPPLLRDVQRNALLLSQEVTPDKGRRDVRFDHTDDDDDDEHNNSKHENYQNGDDDNDKLDKTPQVQNIQIEVVMTDGDGDTGVNNETLMMPRQPSFSGEDGLFLDQNFSRKTYYHADGSEVTDLDNDNDITDDHVDDGGSATGSSSTTRWYRPQHDANLLPLLRLDIVAFPSDRSSKSAVAAGERVHPSSAPKSEEEEGDNGAFSCYSHQHATPAINPTWEHLDERIGIPRSDRRQKGPWWEQTHIYKSMRIQLYVIPPKKDRQIQRSNLTIETGPSGNSQDKTNTNGHRQDERQPFCFMDVPLHPSFLYRIDDGGVTSNAKKKQDPSSSFVNNDSAKSTQVDDIDITNKLANMNFPPNAILVYYSDGSVRCPLSLFQKLWDTNQLVDEPPVEDFSRFEDDVFNALDHVQNTPHRRERTASSLLDQDEDLDHDGSNKQSMETFVTYMPPTSPSLCATTTNGVQHPKSSPSSESEDLLTLERQVPELSIPFPEEGEIIAKQEDLIAEREILLKLIKAEQDAMEEDYRALQDEKRALSQMMQESRVLENETSFVRNEVQYYEQELIREELYQQTLSLKLIRGLSYVYPITLNTPYSNGTAGGTPQAGGQGYTIRALRLPVDIYTTNVPEEEVSASLGYCAHLVYMIAKYLNIPLRHRIICNSSRSAIQQDGSGVLPLFLGRLNVKSLEREQVDKGLRLLGLNVNCILMHVGLLTSSHTSVSGAEDGSRIVIMNNPAENPVENFANNQKRFGNQVLEQSHILARLDAILKFADNRQTGRNGQ